MPWDDVAKILDAGIFWAGMKYNYFTDQLEREADEDFARLEEDILQEADKEEKVVETTVSNEDDNNNNNRPSHKQNGHILPPQPWEKGGDPDQNGNHEIHATV